MIPSTSCSKNCLVFLNPSNEHCTNNLSLALLRLHLLTCVVVEISQIFASVDCKL
eukprot:gene5955-4264_t